MKKRLIVILQILTLIAIGGFVVHKAFEKDKAKAVELNPVVDEKRKDPTAPSYKAGDCFAITSEVKDPTPIEVWEQKKPRKYKQYKVMIVGQAKYLLKVLTPNNKTEVLDYSIFDIDSVTTKIDCPKRLK